MRVCCAILLGMFGCLFTVSAQTEFKEPWKDPSKAFVLDPFHLNDLDWEALATEPRVVGIIHKASEGLRADDKYADRKTEAGRRGYLWGSYHLGRPGDPIKQADFYLATATPSKKDVMALDLEDLTAASMTLEEATQFIERIKKRTGRYPLLYAPTKVRDAIAKTYGKESVFAKTPLWYPRFISDISSVFPTQPALWSTYTLWQFASEINCCPKDTDACPAQPPATCSLPKPISGTDFRMDVNVFNGTVAQLRKKWPFIVR